MLSALKLVLSGSIYVPPLLAQGPPPTRADSGGLPAPPAVAQLTDRQIDVLKHLSTGLSNKEIAIRLDISPRTVENYRAWVMEKMGASNLADLVRKTLLLRKA